MKTLTEKDVRFAIEIAPEDASIEGNCCAIEPETDAETEAYIKRELRNGNEWAWCVVKVTASWKGHKGTDYLGACSYKSEADFIAGGYFEDMKRAALAELNDTIKRACNDLRELCEQ